MCPLDFTVVFTMRLLVNALFNAQSSRRKYIRAGGVVLNKLRILWQQETLAYRIVGGSIQGRDVVRIVLVQRSECGRVK